MKQLSRSELSKPAKHYLSRKQKEVNEGSDVQKTWNSARRTKTLQTIASILCGMVGNRDRCMFCCDSRGTDIDHFRPKAVFKTRAFSWKHMLWVCAGCNRLKGDQFPLDGKGKPLLIDPTAEDPWDFLFFETHTGIITARYDPGTNQYDPKGTRTTDARILPLNVEAVTEGRLRTSRNLRRAVRTFFSSVHNGVPIAQATTELVQAIQDLDDYGLGQWFFLRDGSSEAPFKELKQKHFAAWQAIAALV